MIRSQPTCSLCPHAHNTHSQQGVLWRSLLRVHGRMLGWTGLIKLVHDAIM